MASTTASMAAGFDFANPPGPFPVGFKVVQQYDYGRVYKRMLDPVTAQPTQGERARPVQTLLWYPAAVKGANDGADQGKPLVYRDYVATAMTEENFALADAQVSKATDAMIAEKAHGPNAGRVRFEMQRPMRARRDAGERTGPFPVVIYAPGRDGRAMENADLCEYLASQGYIVIASTSMGPHSRIMSTDLEGAEAQAGDIRFLIGYAHSLRQADTSRVAVIGFSWGGLANVLAAAQDDRIRALVSLDGSMRGFTEYVNGGPKSAKYVSPERLAIPLLYVARRNRTVEEINHTEVDTTFNLMNRMTYSDVYIATMHPMNHMDFSSWALRINPDAAFGDYTREEANAAHDWAMRYVREFLDGYLKDSAESRGFLERRPDDNGAPRHLMSMDVRHAKGAAPTIDSFLAALGKQGFAQIVGIYDDMHAKSAGLTFDPVEVHHWAGELIDAGHAQDALHVLKLGVHIYPTETAFLYDDLAETYELTGNKALAIESYRKALTIDPRRAHATERLKVLDPGEAATARR